jgi:hypothetical protein
MDQDQQNQGETPSVLTTTALYAQVQAQQETISGLIGQLNAFKSTIEGNMSHLATAIEGISKALSSPKEEKAPMEAPVPVPSQAPTQATGGLSAAFNSSQIKELNKRVYSFPEAAKLKGAENFDQWKQALYIQFRAFGLPEFLVDPSVARGLPDPEQAILLMLLRDSCTEGPQAAITWQKLPEEAYRLLVKQYSHSAEIQRGYLYNKYHSLKFQGYKGTLEAFNAEFNNLLARLALSGVEIAPIDQVNQYLQALKTTFPGWAERQRFNMRSNRALGATLETLNLEFLMADLLEEQRDYSSSVSKALTYRAKEDKSKSKDSKKSSKEGSKEGSKGDKKKEGSKTSSNYKGKKPWKKGKTGSKSPKKEDLEEASFAIGNYNLFTGNYEEGDSSDDSSSSSDSEVEEIPRDLEKTGPKESSFNCTTIKRSLLYDTGSTCHIVNNRASFTSYTTYKKGEAKPIITGGGPIYPKGYGTATFEVLIGTEPLTYRKLALKNAVFFPEIDTNILSGLLHYMAGGILTHNKLYLGDRTLFGLLNPKKHGFFLPIKDQPTPTIQKSSNHRAFMGLQAQIQPYLSYSHPIQVQLPSKAPKWAKEAEAIEPIEESLGDGALSPQGSGDLMEDRPRVPSVPEALEGPVEDRWVPINTGDLEGAIEAPKGPLEACVPQGTQTQGPKGDSSINPLETLIEGIKDYKKLLELAGLWHVRLGHIGLPLLKKTASITKGMPDFSLIRDKDFKCLACTKTKAIRRPSKQPIGDPPSALDVIEGDTVKISPMPYNKKPIVLFLIDRKSRNKWAILLPNKEGPTIKEAIKSLFKGFKVHYGRYPKRLHFDGGTEALPAEAWLASKGIAFSTSEPYNHGQNGLIERAIRVILDRLRATLEWAKLPLYLWCFILPAVIDLINTTANSTKPASPRELFLKDIAPNTPYKTNFQSLRAIGAYCEVIIPIEHRANA